MRPDTLTELSKISNQRKSGEKLVFTNGCFDILHVGHTRYLADAKRLGALIVVGLNSDSSTRGLKGPTRPIIHEAERREVLLALKSVDFVCVFDEPTPYELIQILKPDVLVKGGDWPVEKIVGADIVLGYGGQVLSLPFHPGNSTTSIVEKIVTL